MFSVNSLQKEVVPVCDTFNRHAPAVALNFSGTTKSPAAKNAARPRKHQKSNTEILLRHKKRNGTCRYLIAAYPCNRSVRCRC